jgi:hypothetical protein
LSDTTAAKIADLRRAGFSFRAIAEAAELSVGAVHRASKPGNFLAASMESRILEIRVV